MPPHFQILKAVSHPNITDVNEALLMGRAGNSIDRPARYHVLQRRCSVMRSIDGRKLSEGSGSTEKPESLGEGLEAETGGIVGDDGTFTRSAIQAAFDLL